MSRKESAFGFRLMALGFKFRDLLRPRSRILQEVGIKPSDRVLDFGCGPGGYIIAISRLVGPGGEVIALDVSRLAVRAVENIIFKNGLRNVRTMRSGLKTGLPDGSVDIALLYDLFHELSNPDAVLDELARVLKPDGVLSVSDHHLDEQAIISGITSTGRFTLGKRGKSVYNFTITSR